MNDAIAELLRDRIESLAFVDKICGLVHVVTKQRAGKEVTIPVGINVTDALQCGDAEILDMVPDERYRTIVYFEGAGITNTRSRTRGTTWTSKIRLVCWVNTKKLNGDPMAAGKIIREFLGQLHHGPYNDGAFMGIRHRIEGMPIQGPELFSRYTYNEAVRQYLMPGRFDAFGIDIITTFRENPNCETPVDLTDVDCWTPPATHRRRHPKDFTCEELIDPINGLTAEQLGSECLNCGGVVACTGVDIRDSDGNLITHISDGGTYILDPIMLRYTNEAAALADAATIPTLQQEVVLNDTLRRYPGDGASTVAALVAANKFNPAFTEDPATGLHTIFDGGDMIIQNA